MVNLRIEPSELSPQRRLVFEAMLTHEFMATSTLAKKCKLKANTVSSVLTYLRRKGYVKSELRPGSTELRHKRLTERLLCPQGDFKHYGAKSVKHTRKRKPTLASDLEELQVVLAKMERAYREAVEVTTRVIHKAEKLTALKEALDSLD